MQVTHFENESIVMPSIIWIFLSLEEYCTEK